MLREVYLISWATLARCLVPRISLLLVLLFDEVMRLVFLLRSTESCRIALHGSTGRCVVVLSRGTVFIFGLALVDLGKDLIEGVENLILNEILIAAPHLSRCHLAGQHQVSSTSVSLVMTVLLRLLLLLLLR